ncbi:MAG: XRE family transcriptional regulator [Burkholderiales bacterium]
MLAIRVGVADFGHPNAAAEKIKAHLAAEIIKVMDAREMTARQAEAVTKIAATDFSRIRHVKFDRFTIDRMAGIFDGLHQRISAKVSVTSRRRTESGGA